MSGCPSRGPLPTTAHRPLRPTGGSTSARRCQAGRPQQPRPAPVAAPAPSMGMQPSMPMQQAPPPSPPPPQQPQSFDPFSGIGALGGSSPPPASSPMGGGMPGGGMGMGMAMGGGGGAPMGMGMGMGMPPAASGGFAPAQPSPPKKGGGDPFDEFDIFK
mmetsp:Transcript_106664/g.267351  ORF Transcript_106664/g.267351 Transcript_106664/m.267351 type:complete len:159 (-) Transcript_106664:118-594(-)